MNPKFLMQKMKCDNCNKKTKELFLSKNFINEICSECKGVELNEGRFKELQTNTVGSF